MQGATTSATLSRIASSLLLAFTRDSHLPNPPHFYHGLLTVKFPNRALAPAATVIALCGLLTGCSSFEKRVVAVESRQAAIQAQIADLQTAQENIIARLVQVRQELDNALQPLRSQSADRGQDLRSMVREVTALEEQILELDDRISSLSEQVATGRGVSNATPQVGTAMPPPRGARTLATPRGETPLTNSQATSLYNSAYTDYLRDNYDLCVQGFEEYLRRFGTSDRGDDARYWIGVCQAAAGDNEAARKSFRTLIREYPSSDLVPDALFNDALIVRQQGNREAALGAFRRLIRGYLTSDAAFLACRELAKLGADPPSSCEELQN